MSPDGKPRVSDLSRGGLLVSWGDWSAQIGSYPETIKDTMATDEGVPQLFLAPEQMFDFEAGVSAVELEFPVYYNFYLKGRKTTIVCRPDQLRALARVLREAIFGPSSLDIAREYVDGGQVPGFPDMAKEMAFFKESPDRPKGRLQLRDLVDFVVAEVGRPADLGEGRSICFFNDERYLFERDGEKFEVLFEPKGAPVPDPGNPHPFSPPVFGVTVIGSGHGFDASSNTSGFLLWLNGRGILVDPPVNSTEWLRNNGIDGRLIEEVILTHCHADHDSGTLQKCMEEGRVRIVSTPTVMDSFVRKYRGLLGLSDDETRRLFDFEPVTIGVPLNVAGGDFLFHYNLHPIPTLGFRVSFLGKSFAYSCDTFYDPKAIAELAEQGVLSQARAAELSSFPSDCDMIFHEAGIPPIHTPLQVLNELPAAVKDKLFLTHISASSLAETDLKLAPPGVDSTLRFEGLLPPELGLAQRMLDVLRHVELFREIGINKASEFLRIVHYQQIPAGKMVVRTGDPSDDFYIILAGEANVIRDGHVLTTIGRFDYFGEMAIVLKSARTADVVAISDMELLSISGPEFLRFFRDTDLLNVLERVARNRAHNSWPLVAENRFLNRLSTYQKTQLVAAMVHQELKPREQLFEGFHPADTLWLVEKGKLTVTDGDTTELATRGHLVGKFEPGTRLEAFGVAGEGTEVYAFTPERLRLFFNANPGTYVRYLTQLRAWDLPILH